jgi:HK97 family phage portal protein
MKFLGFEITLAKKDLYQVGSHYGYGGWTPLVNEPWAGAWQCNRELRFEDITAFHAVFACITLIASDISKLGVSVIRLEGGVWQQSTSPTYDPLLRTPNHYQNYIQFWESWILSKLLRGNTYVLKGRDQRNVVNRLYVLDPNRVRVLQSESGSVFYQLMDDSLSGTRDLPSLDVDGSGGITVPASEIIHDRMNCFYHPLCGIPPIYAASLAARQGLTIQTQSLEFFDNHAMPGGVLTSPTRLPDQVVASMKQQWETNYGGNNRGKVAILGGGLKFDPVHVTQRDAQMIETAKATAEWVCSVFHVPPYKIGIGPMPSYNNIQALNVEYYSQCLQSLIEAAEVSLDQGLDLKPSIGVQFNLDVLLRMDTVSLVSSLKESVMGGMHTPNEARAKLGLPPKAGGDSPYLQQQNYSLAALDKRDSQENPFAPSVPPAPPEPEPPQESDDDDDEGSPEERAAAIRESAAHIFNLAKRRAA